MHHNYIEVVYIDDNDQMQHQAISNEVKNF